MRANDHAYGENVIFCIDRCGEELRRCVGEEVVEHANLLVEFGVGQWYWRRGVRRKGEKLRK